MGMSERSLQVNQYLYPCSYYAMKINEQAFPRKELLKSNSSTAWGGICRQLNTPWSSVQSVQGHPGGDDEEETFVVPTLPTLPSWIIGLAPSGCWGSWEASKVKGRPSNCEEFVEENPAQPARKMRLGWLILHGGGGVEQTGHSVAWARPAGHWQFGKCCRGNLWEVYCPNVACAEICFQYKIMQFLVILFIYFCS